MMKGDPSIIHSDIVPPSLQPPDGWYGPEDQSASSNEAVVGRGVLLAGGEKSDRK